jgi:hypothetical protein
MNLLEKVKSLDLNITVPRSSRETMTGIAHLPRMIDKARALENNMLGEYIYPCPLDWQVLKHLNVDPGTFAELAAQNTDDQMFEWTQEVAPANTWQQRNALNTKILNRKVDPKDMHYFLGQRHMFDPTRTDVITWDALTDLEEGRI